MITIDPDYKQIMGAVGPFFDIQLLTALFKYLGASAVAVFGQRSAGIAERYAAGLNFRIGQRLG
ncbi:hypothetical protein HUJ04_012136 [Dendroctonus ponderosae]|nr:hypothetical protein HUJ04_012136 [Dendroctonus ponderosae]KAH1029269.1 hypothetical protein HUJ05_002534 [Dendroctonus ponderosae]